ncbi:unnamed protein product [Acanthosepion pharaonis]|uniref:Major facilitator superfamily associated domain-containing protein n=1 Tax=Acanthosepion pharaonis TaxID=158019 RepID=A0A812AWC7_ACAPH|nr:unnamed protein product [Sepia pharaonis]
MREEEEENKESTCGLLLSPSSFLLPLSGYISAILFISPPPRFISSPFSLSRSLSFVVHTLICIFYFFFFAAFGSLFPLMAVYFRQLGMNPTQGGILIGFRPFVEFCSAPLWGVFADKWKKGKQLLLFSLFGWIAFTLSLAFVHPPAHSCISTNSTHIFLSEPYTRKRRDIGTGDGWIPQENPFLYKSPNLPHYNNDKVAKSLVENYAAQEQAINDLHHPNSLHGLTDSEKLTDIDDLIGTVDDLPAARSRVKRVKPKHEGYEIDHTKIANKNKDEVAGLVSPRFSTIVYREDQVRQVFFVLLLLVIVGEFFSAPAITLADSVTLAYLGDDVENYGRQRMFGSLGWGIAMFLVGMALDHSTTFPNHPCGTQELGEKNYVICFAVFSVLMSCALITATQFNFSFHQGSMDIPLQQIASQIKDKIKETVTGRRKIDRVRLVEEDDFDYYTKDKAHIESSFPEKTPPDKLHISLDKQSDMVSDTVNGHASGSGLRRLPDTFWCGLGLQSYIRTLGIFPQREVYFKIRKLVSPLPSFRLCISYYNLLSLLLSLSRSFLLYLSLVHSFYPPYALFLSLSKNSLSILISFFLFTIF